MTFEVTEVTTMLFTASMVLLIVLLMLKTIISSETENKYVKYFIKGSNVVIIPLLVLFVIMVIYKASIQPI